ncbi:MAG: hypothetical protein ACR2HR_06165 [Euzebya sp.]
MEKEGSPTPTTHSPPDADRRTVRRALRTGGIVALVMTVATGLANAAFGGDGITAGIWFTSSLVVGALVASGWLILALLLDLIAGVLPGRRRMWWTVGLFAVAFVSPILPAAMVQVAAQQ